MPVAFGGGKSIRTPYLAQVFILQYVGSSLVALKATKNDQKRPKTTKSDQKRHGNGWSVRSGQLAVRRRERGERALSQCRRLCGCQRARGIHIKKSPVKLRVGARSIKRYSNICRTCVKGDFWNVRFKGLVEWHGRGGSSLGCWMYL